MGFGNLKLDAGQRHGFFTKVVCLQGFRCHIVPAQSTFGSFVLVFSIVSKTADGKTPAMSFKPFSNGHWSHKANQGLCSCLLSTFSPSFYVLLGCSTYDPTLLGNIALKFVFYPGQSGTPTCRACDGVTRPHLHLLSPPTFYGCSIWAFHSFQGQWVFYPRRGSGSHIQGCDGGTRGKQSLV